MGYEANNGFSNILCGTNLHKESTLKKFVQQTSAKTALTAPILFQNTWGFLWI
jgi:hypothetical protein